MNVKFMKLYMTSLMLLCFVSASAAPIPENCPTLSKSREWSSTCFEMIGGKRQVKKQFRKNLVFSKTSYTGIIMTPPSKLISVNRRGQVVPLKKKHLSDFDFEPIDGKIGRFSYIQRFGHNSTDYKCGYYRRGKFAVLVPPVYDQCDSFQNGFALVCIGCTFPCPSGDCHDIDFVGGEGIIIDENHKIIRRYKLPTAPKCDEDSDEQAAVTGKCRRTSDFPRPEQQSIPEIDPIFAPKEKKNGR